MILFEGIRHSLAIAAPYRVHVIADVATLAIASLVSVGEFLAHGLRHTAVATGCMRGRPHQAALSGT